MTTDRSRRQFFTTAAAAAAWTTRNGGTGGAWRVLRAPIIRRLAVRPFDMPLGIPRRHVRARMMGSLVLCRPALSRS